MTLKIHGAVGASQETHPDLFRGAEAIADEFPDGWGLHFITGPTENLEAKLVASGCSQIPPERQTADGIQKVLRDMFRNLTERK
jgi:hypothetical protein